MAADIIVGIGALKTAFDIARGLKEIDDATKRNAAIIDLQQIILDAQRAQLELLNEVEEMRAKLKSEEDKQTELGRYEMVDVRGSGEFAYRLKPEEAGGKPVHFVCPACYEAGKISTLHAEGHLEGQDWFLCRRCDKRMSFGTYVAREIPTMKSNYF